jgi:hypothetical protein
MVAFKKTKSITGISLDRVSVASVTEPSTMALLGLGSLGLDDGRSEQSPVKDSMRPCDRLEFTDFRQNTAPTANTLPIGFGGMAFGGCLGPFTITTTGENQQRPESWLDNEVFLAGQA